MRKTIDKIIKAMQVFAVCVDQKKMTMDEIRDKIIAITLLLEECQSLSDDMSLENITVMHEKLEFLIFMQAKNVKVMNTVQLIEGEMLFKQWRDAKATAEKMKPVPNEEN